jgi:hypothetical protein
MTNVDRYEVVSLTILDFFAHLHLIMAAALLLLVWFQLSADRFRNSS